MDPTFGSRVPRYMHEGVCVRIETEMVARRRGVPFVAEYVFHSQGDSVEFLLFSRVMRRSDDVTVIRVYDVTVNYESGEVDNVTDIVRRASQNGEWIPPSPNEPTIVFFTADNCILRDGDYSVDAEFGIIINGVEVDRFRERATFRFRYTNRIWSGWWNCLMENGA